MTQAPRPGPAPRVRVPAPSPALGRFLATEAGGAALLLAATVIALVWANAPFAETYHQLWDAPADLRLGDLTVHLDLHGWVNDAAMSVFFLVVGLEITRELTTGELRDRRAVAVPALGAVGGLLAPAVIYSVFNPAGEAARGWGIAMSTDTAFVIGVLALVGPRCPDRLRLFMLTLAIVDDLGAITVMAVFYSEGLSLPALATAGAVVVVLAAMRWMRVWRLSPYLLAGVLLWLVLHESGVHPTLAGVLLGLLIPARPPQQENVDQVPTYSRAVQEQPDAERVNLAVLAARAAVPANARLTYVLHPWSAFLVVPVFGLANAGVSLDGATLRAAAASPVTLGVVVALLVGNTVGITAGATLALRAGWGVLPGRVRYTHLVGGATLAGIGFTIALFITGLAFRDPALQDQAKIGILVGSLVAAALGTLVLRTLGERSSLCSPDTASVPTLPPRPWYEPAPGR
ncbi:Na+/H+ antiporter NhaA [Georgenia sp. SYP-B2076]|uniref:Na+/H+ antiporter NhaA n=1 Tax=Georgenia sp. SYP-B2076 TaxID=2495881 RepID=UPI000F8ECC7E|nr:Na+/H+ antiporter NhaA [Georgenia sp. SYP-B2076]